MPIFGYEEYHSLIPPSIISLTERLSGQYKQILIGKMVAIYTIKMSIKFKCEHPCDTIVFEEGDEEVHQGLVIRPYLYQ